MKQTSANDNTPFVTYDSIADDSKCLENVSMKLFKWLADNQMKANKDRCHFLMSSNENSTVNVDGSIIGERTCEKIFSANGDYRLNLTNT